MDLSAPVSAILRRSRAWGSPESGPWRASSFAVIDVETTGLDLDRDEIISIGVARVDGGRITPEVFYEVARPSRRISEDAMCLHALTIDELAAAPIFDEIVPRLRERVAGCVVVAHAAWVERAFLNRALRRSRQRLPRRVVDTAALARSLGLVESSAHEPSLELLARRFGLPVHTPHHALGDAMTTAEVFLVLATRLEQERGSLGAEDLLEISERLGH